MKKIILFTLVLSALLAFSTGCAEKCSTCSYTFDDGLGGTQTITAQEVCGSKSDIDDYEEATETAAALVNGTVSCVRE